MTPEADASLFRELDQSRVPLARVHAWLRSDAEALVHAAVLHVAARLRQGERISLAELLPSDASGMAPETQIVLAQLAVEGFAIPLPEIAPGAVPAVRLAWLRAHLLANPESMAVWEATPLAAEAVSDLPPERVASTGLLQRIMDSPRDDVRRCALGYVQRGLERGVVSLAHAHEAAAALARDAHVPIAVGALRLLRGAWAYGMPLPERALRDEDDDLYVATVELLAARGDVGRVRRLLAKHVGDDARTPPLFEALGEIGDAADIPSLVAALDADAPAGRGPALAALVALKRRGISSSDEEALAILVAYLEGAPLEASAVAEATSSRADRIVTELGTLVGDGVPWARVVALLEGYATKRAIARLEEIVARDLERDGWWYAIHALGRLGVASAEATILSRLEAEPDACIAALGALGGDATVQHFAARLIPQAAPLPVWAADAAVRLLELAPSAELFDALAERGLLAPGTLQALPLENGAAQSATMRAIVAEPGHALRVLAIRSLGRAGGALAAGDLAPLLSESDDDVRAEAAAALRALGARRRANGARRPVGLEGASDPGAFLLADTLLGRLRTRQLDLDELAHLLDALRGLAHPQLVAVVRPYLRERAPEVRKRAIACLAAAGPAAASWLLPWLDDEDVTLSRQVLSALGQTRARGLASKIAVWLDHPNMNLKKTAAEALAVCGDASVVPKLLHWLGAHDNTGFRALLVAALEAILGSAFRAVVVDELAAAPDARTSLLFIEALERKVTAAEVASIVAVRGQTSAWSARWVARILAGNFVFGEGSTVTFEAELHRRGVGALVLNHAIEGDDAWRALAARAGVDLQAALREQPLREGSLRTMLAALPRANVAGQLACPRLSRWEAHALLDAYPRLPDDARAGARIVLSRSELDAVGRLRVARLLAELPGTNGIPASLITCRFDSMTADEARTFLDWPDAAVQEAALRVVRLGASARLDDAPIQDAGLAAVVRDMIARGDIDACLSWCRQRGHTALWVRALLSRLGASAALAHLQRSADEDPTLLEAFLPELFAFGTTAHAAIARVASTRAVPLGLRERALALLGRRVPFGGRTLALLRRMLADEHASLREQAATCLLQNGDPGDRRAILGDFVAGRFRQSMELELHHADLPMLESLYASSEATPRGARGVRLVRLAARLDGLDGVGLLLRSWKLDDGDVTAEARDALRRIDPERLLPFVLREIDAGNVAALDVLRANASVPRALVARVALGDAAWERFLERMAGGGVLHAPGLAASYARALRDGDGALVASFLRLGDWSDARKVPALLAALQPVLDGAARERTIALALAATATLAPKARALVLVSLGRPTDDALVTELANATLASPAVRPMIPDAMLAAVERRLTEGLDGEAERVRRILTYRAARARSEVEREALTVTLERSMHHPALRVRLHAHRLLRAHAERPRYLAATRPLLRERDAATVRSAIRALTHGGDIEAVPQIAELLSHGESVVREAARAGLVRLGPKGVSAITKAMARARPDRRDVYADVLARIDRGSRDDEDDGDDEDDDESARAVGREQEVENPGFGGVPRRL